MFYSPVGWPPTFIIQAKGSVASVSVDITQLSAHLAPPLQDQVKEAYKKQAKSDTTAFLLTFFLGLVGAHRFYLNQWLSGIAHLALTIAGVIVLVEGLINSGDSRFTLIIVGVALLLIGLLWEAIDLFVIDRQVNARNLALAERLIADAELSDDTPEKSALAELDKLSRATAASEPPEIATESTSTEPISSAEVGEPSPTMVEPAVEEQTASGPSAAEEAGVGALAGAGAAAAIEQPTQPASTLNMVAPDHTDAHPVDIESAPMADVATPGASVIRVNIPDAEQSAPEPDVAAMTESPVDSALPPVEPEPQEYVPPTVPMSDLTNTPTNDPTDVAVAPVVATEPDATAEPAAGSPSGAEIAGAAVLATLAGAGAAMAGDALLHNESNEAPAATEPAPATAPTADEAPTAPAMKRIRAVRQIVVDGKVVSEVSAEEIVPIDADSAQVEAELQERLGHLTAEQIAEMTHLSPDEIELHQQSES